MHLSPQCAKAIAVSQKTCYEKIGLMVMLHSCLEITGDKWLSWVPTPRQPTISSCLSVMPSLGKTSYWTSSLLIDSTSTSVKRFLESPPLPVNCKAVSNRTFPEMVLDPAAASFQIETAKYLLDCNLRESSLPSIPIQGAPGTPTRTLPKTWPIKNQEHQIQVSESSIESSS